ncbi:MAG: radical SAM protein [Victivallaceae bacterium]|nr:radical SAM protein [Victivallaceae bacterium]
MYLGKEYVFSRPTFLHLMGQYRCNYSCSFCGFDYRSNARSTQMNAEQYRTLLKHLHPSLLQGVCFSGMGEPLLWDALPEMLQFTAEKYPWIGRSINTNGELFEGRSLSLAARYCSEVIVSLHSLHPETHAVLSGRPGALERVLKNLAALRQMAPDLPIVLYYAYSAKNIDEMPEHVKFCHSLGNCRFQGAYMKFYSCKRRFSDSGNPDFFSIPDREDSLFLHQEKADAKILEAMRVAQQLDFDRQCEFPPLFAAPRKNRLRCSFPYLQIMVGPDAVVYPCGGSEVLMYDRIAQRTLWFGNLLESRIDQIWNLPDYRLLRRASHAAALGQGEAQNDCANCTSMGFLVDSGNEERTHFIKVPLAEEKHPEAE